MGHRMVMSAAFLRRVVVVAAAAVVARVRPHARRERVERQHRREEKEEEDEPRATRPTRSAKRVLPPRAAMCSRALRVVYSTVVVVLAWLAVLS